MVARVVGDMVVGEDGGDGGRGAGAGAGAGAAVGAALVWAAASGARVVKRSGQTRWSVRRGRYGGVARAEAEAEALLLVGALGEARVRAPDVAASCGLGESFWPSFCENRPTHPELPNLDGSNECLLSFVGLSASLVLCLTRGDSPQFGLDWSKTPQNLIIA